MQIKKLGLKNHYDQKNRQNRTDYINDFFEPDSGNIIINKKLIIHLKCKVSYKKITITDLFISNQESIK